MQKRKKQAPRQSRSVTWLTLPWDKTPPEQRVAWSWLWRRLLAPGDQNTREEAQDHPAQAHKDK